MLFWLLVTSANCNYLQQWEEEGEGAAAGEGGRTEGQKGRWRQDRHSMTCLTCTSIVTVIRALNVLLQAHEGFGLPRVEDF